jgi:hypothetical protein
MSSKSAKRKDGFKKRDQKRNKEKERREAIIGAKDIESLAKAMGIKLE